MGTTFESIYKIFLNHIDDPTFAEMTDEDAVEIMHDMLITSIASVREFKDGGYTLTSDKSAFLYNLSMSEQEVLALGMVEAWIGGQANSVALTKQFIATKEENFFAQHNHLNGLLASKRDTFHHKERIRSRYKTLHNSYLETEEALDDTTVIPIPDGSGDDSGSGSSDVTPTIVGTTDYNDLINKPSINDVTLQGNLLITALMNENVTTGEQAIDVMISDAFGDDGS